MAALPSLPVRGRDAQLAVLDERLNGRGRSAP